MSDEPLRRFDQARSVLDQVLARVGPDQWANPTPCTEWDVRAVVHHLVDSNRMVTAMARGEQPPAGGDETPEGEETPGEEEAALLERLRRTTDEAREALSAPGLFERIVTTPMGEQPGVTLAMVRIVDMYVHGWDIAVATGQSTDLDPDLAGYLDAYCRETLSERPSGGPFDAEREAPSGAGAADRLAAYLGRPVPA